MKVSLTQIKPNPHQELVPPMREDEYQDLLQDIRENGILQPIDVNHDYVILDGHHRYRAAKELGIKELDVRIPELIDISETEYMLSVALNRRHLTEAQKATLAVAYKRVNSERRKRERAENAASVVERDSLGRFNRLSETSSNKRQESTESSTEKDSRKEAAEKFKISEWKVRQVEEIQKKSPLLFEKMHSGELEIHEAKRLLKEKEEVAKEVIERKKKEPNKSIGRVLGEVTFGRKKEELEVKVSQLSPLETKYAVIVIDPPWKYGSTYDPYGRRVGADYPEMTVEEIKKIELPAMDDCVLWIWTTNKYLRDTFDVLDAWGFRYINTLTWAKDRIGVGEYLRGQTEHCLLAFKGNPVFKMGTSRSTLLNAPNRGHSIKPDEFYQMVEELCPGNKLDYFYGKKREGWDNYGTERKR